MSNSCPYCFAEVTFTTTTVDQTGSWTVYQPCGHPAPPPQALTYADFLVGEAAHQTYQADRANGRRRMDRV